MQLRHPSSLDSAISLATEFEAFDSFTTCKPSNEEYIRPVQNQDVNAQTSLEKLVSSLNDKIDSLSVNKMSGYNKKQGNRSARRQRVCYNCHEEGHISTYCPLKQNRSVHNQENYNLGSAPAQSTCTLPNEIKNTPNQNSLN